MVKKRAWLFRACLSLAAILPAGVHARSIQSQLPLKFFEMGADGKPDRFLGATPSQGAGVVVPSKARWYVYPGGSYSPERWKTLAQEIKRLRIHGLDLSDRLDFKPETLKALEGTESLRVLFLARTRMNDAWLVSVGKLTGLEILTLSPNVTDAGITHLKNLKQLRRLEAAGARLTNHALPIFKGFSHLEKLDISGAWINDAGGPVLASVRSLRELDVSDTSLTDQGAAPLAALPLLKSLYVPDGVTDATVLKLAKLKTLRSLDLSGAQVSLQAVTTLAKSVGLQELALSGTPLTNSVLPALSEMKDLRTLEISDTAITSAGFEGLKGFTRLKTLGVSWATVSDSEVQALGELPKLSTVILSGWTLSEDSLRKIRQMARLNKSSRTPPTLLAQSPNPVMRAPPPMLPSAMPAAKLHAPITKAPAPQPGMSPVVSPSPRAVSKSAPPIRTVLASLPRTPAITPAYPSPAPSIRSPSNDSILTPPKLRDAGVSRSSRLTDPMMPRDLIPTPMEPPKATDGTPQGEGMMIEINAGPAPGRRRRVRGLKRIHQFELGHSPNEMELASGEGPQITQPRETPENSLGEINVGVEK